MSTPENDPTPAAAGVGVAVDDELEEFSEEFKCCVCLELIFKPVVLACGHISCFWCVLESMENRREILQEACCPVCRHTYYHFPSICWLLQSELRKLYPNVCLRRESQVAEKEKEYGKFSPQFENYIAASHGSEQISSQFHSLVVPKDCSDKKSPEPVPSDLLCVICKELLYRPVVLNCGHVFCEACIIDSCNESCRCPVCQSMHPNGFPKVCLVLVGFLEQHKSEEYAARRVAIEKVRSCDLGGSSTGSTQVQQGAKSSSVPLHKYFCYSGHKVHDEVGCDSCGIYPLIGDRYKCKDCSVDIGFDLCGKCYNSSSNAPGRFNQQHKPDHTFELVEIDYIIVPSANNPCNIALGNPENQTNVAAPNPPLDTQRAPENDVAGPDRANDSSSADDDEGIEPTS